MDAIAGRLVGLAARDASFAGLWRAPLAKIEAFKRRMNRAFRWAPSFNFNFS